MYASTAKVLRKGIAISVAMLLTACASEMQRAEANAQRQALDKQLNTPVDVKVDKPAFDEAQAKAALIEGGATIKGVVFHKIRSGGPDAGRDAALLNFSRGTPMAGVKVYLYPATAHVLELSRLERENRSARRRGKAQLKNFHGDPRVYKYVLVAITDANGLFEFPKMRPGRYLVLAENMMITSNGSETVVTGFHQEGSGVYMVSGGVGAEIPRTVVDQEQRNFRVNTEVEYSEVIEVPNGNAVVKIEARMRPVS